MSKIHNLLANPAFVASLIDVPTVGGTFRFLSYPSFNIPVDYEDTVSFTVTTTQDANTPSFQWKYSTDRKFADNLTENFSNSAGTVYHDKVENATTSVLTIRNAQETYDGMWIRCSATYSGTTIHHNPSYFNVMAEGDN